MKNFCYKYLGFILLGLMMWAPQVHAQRYWNVAAKFEGDQQSYIAVSPYSTLKNLTGSFTVECWFNSEGGGTATLFGKDGVRLMLDPTGTDKVIGRLQTSNNTKLYTRSAGMDINKWYHLACTYDATGGGLMTFYINGSYDTSMTGTGLGAAAGTDSVLIGKSNSYGVFKGMLDDVRIWNRALSGTEIANNMRNPYVGVLSYQTPNFGTGCVMASSFDFTYSGGGGQLYFYDGYNDYVVHGASGYYLGSHPSQTLATNSALDISNGGHAAMPSNADIELAGPMTMEAWVYPTFASTDVRYIIAKKAGWNDPGYAIYYTLVSGVPKIRFKNNGSGILSNAAVPLNQWTHIATTISPAGNAKIYINGILDTESGLGLPEANTDSLYIGSIKNGLATDEFVGYIDGVKISNYEKSQQEITDGIFRITDFSNKPSPPNSTVSLNFDYMDYSTTGNGAYYYLRGNGKYTSPTAFSNVPVSPVMGNNITTFPNEYTIKTSNRRIPQFNTAGYMEDDSISISSTTPISDIKIFIGLNHTRLSDLVITLMAPTGDSVIVWNQNRGVNSRVESIATIFDDDAPDAMINNLYADFGPTLQPYNSLKTILTGKNPHGTWRLKVTDLFNGSTGYLYGWGININNISGIKGESTTEIPNHYQLDQNYPNPFNPTTTISYQLPISSIVTLKMYDILGREIATLVNEKKDAGKYVIDFNGSYLPSGVYVYRIQAGSFVETKKMMLLK
jgi:subtilisin-like proprotein convertase family protein